MSKFMDKLVSPDAAVNAYVADVVGQMLSISSHALRCGALYEEIKLLDRMLVDAQEWRRESMGRFRRGEPLVKYPNKLFPPQIEQVRQRLRWMLAESAANNRAEHGMAEPRDPAHAAEQTRLARAEQNLRLARAH